ncbi:UbiA family prenyltransferase [Halomonas salipaludis]|uniref:Manganese transporter permease n=1 Tax=Halomonas salipaludis TaxID=2032625 RepID=A0A2A2EYL2_9GAMM|nr:UbiA family prenyltransferase [Halomonas salipaludis]PAU78481.1 manganese transporter permease [Halomonas salipaludis]
MSAQEMTLPLAQRLWIYQRERFPVVRTAVLVAAFSAASVNVSAFLADRPLPAFAAYLVAFVVAFLVFMQLRVCDEVKDRDIDRRFRPALPVPRGLVSLAVIVGFGLAGVPLAAVAAAVLDPRLLWLLALVWLWLGLMTMEFFVPHWLKARPFFYVVSHMMIMPLLDLFVTGCEWLVAGGGPPQWLWLFLVLSFVNGCVLEVGRKIRAPEQEREGVDTYSALLGPGRATLLWCALTIVAFGFLLAVGSAVGAFYLIGLVGLAGLAACLACAARYLRAPTEGAQRRIDSMAGLWVLTCYGAAGFAPLAAWGSP